MARLDADNIRRMIPTETAARLDRLEVFREIGSTNTYLMQQAAPARGRIRVAIADHQTAGRGRHERRWESPAGTGLYLSMAGTVDAPAQSVPRLTLAVGVAAVEALRRLDVSRVSLKWPNDLIANDAKLGGILTEYRSDGASSGTVVVGIGINVDTGDALRSSIAAGRVGRVADLASIVDARPSREKLSAALIEQLSGTLERFSDDGFAAFRDAWLACDWLRGREVIVEMASGHVRGTADGIDEHGALEVITPDGRHRVASGSVSIPESGDVVA